MTPVTHADLDALRTELLAEIAAARRLTSFVPAVLAFLVTGGFIASTIVLLFGKWDPATVNSPVVVTMLTGMGTMSVGIMAYFFGATQAGAANDAEARKDRATARADLATSQAGHGSGTLDLASKNLESSDKIVAQATDNLERSDKIIVQANKNLASSIPP